MAHVRTIRRYVLCPNYVTIELWTEPIGPLPTVLLFIIFLPHPSYLITLSSFYLKTRHAPWRFGAHLFAVHALTMGTLASLVVCIVRDPGSVRREWHGHKNKKRVGLGQNRNSTARPHERDADTEDGVTTSLLRGDGETYDGDAHDAERGGTEEEGYETHGGNIAAAEDGDGEAASSRTNDMDIDALSLNGRWCGRCRLARPERAHHCGICGRCVLKMGECGQTFFISSNAHVS